VPLLATALFLAFAAQEPEPSRGVGPGRATSESVGAPHGESAGRTAAATSVRRRCDRYASLVGGDSAQGTRKAPYRSVAKLLSVLRPGETGCLLAGVFSEHVHITRGGRLGKRITLQGAPGRRTTIAGFVEIADSANFVTVQELRIDGSSAAPITFHVYGDNAVIRNNDVTNGRRASRSCLITGSSEYGLAHNILVAGNRIYGCGTRDLDHGIYGQGIRGGRITNNTIYDNAGLGVKMAPDSWDVRVDHNVIDGNGFEGKKRSGVNFGQNSESDPPTVGTRRTVYELNIVTWSGRYGVESYYPTGSGVGNVFRGNCLFGNALGDLGSDFRDYSAYGNLHADPLYVNRAGKDFRLRKGGPCADKAPR
jgi:hypothetical protein